MKAFWKGEERTRLGIINVLFSLHFIYEILGVRVRGLLFTEQVYILICLPWELLETVSHGVWKLTAAVTVGVF